MAPSARLLCLIDITGCMTNELAGVKHAVSTLAADAARMVRYECSRTCVRP